MSARWRLPWKLGTPSRTGSRWQLAEFSTHANVAREAAHAYREHRRPEESRLPPLLRPQWHSTILALVRGQESNKFSSDAAQARLMIFPDGNAISLISRVAKRAAGQAMNVEVGVRTHRCALLCVLVHAFVETSRVLPAATAR
jgi:hypothetical protein